MLITIQVSSFLDALGTVKRVVPNAVDALLTATKGKVYVTAAVDSACKVLVHNSDVEEDGEAPINIADISGVVKGRNIIKFRLVTDKEHSVLKFSDSKKYSGSLNLPTSIDIETSRPKTGMVLELDTNLSEFNSIVESVSLTGSFSNTPDLPVYISMGPEGTTAICYDSYYLCKVNNTNAVYEEPKLFAVDLRILDTVVSTMEKEPYTMVITDATLYAYNKFIYSRFPITQVEAIDTTLATITEYTENWRTKKNKVKLTISVERLREVLTNISYLYTNGNPVLLEVLSDKVIQVGITANSGAVKEKISVISSKNIPDTKFTVKCEYSLLNELIAKIKVKEVTISILPDNTVVLIESEERDGVSLLMSAATVGE